MVRELVCNYCTPNLILKVILTVGNVSFPREVESFRDSLTFVVKSQHLVGMLKNI